MLKFANIKKYFKVMGPGLITGASDDDPSGIATYSQAGAMFGLATLWTAFFTFPLMASIQETCARIGMVTSKGLMSNIKSHYHPTIMYVILLFLIPAIIFNISADIAGMAAVSNLLVPAVPTFIFSIFYIVLILAFMIFFSYNNVSYLLKLLCLSLIFYIIVPFMVQQNWYDIAEHTFILQIQWNKDFFSLLVAVLGTTISPYLFFWQATMEAEDKRHQPTRSVTKTDKKILKIDVISGMFISNIVMYFIILSAGTILHPHGITEIVSVEQAAQSLRPIAGNLCYLVFALGVIGTGLLTVPVLSGALSYVLSSVFSCPSGLDKKYHEAKVFYSVIVISLFLSIFINVLNISPIKALVYSAIFYGLIAPLIIFVIIMISNNKNIMGKHKNGILSNFLNITTLLLMSIASLLLIYFQFSS